MTTTSMNVYVSNPSNIHSLAIDFVEVNSEGGQIKR
jgi:hypothetical protein